MKKYLVLNKKEEVVGEFEAFEKHAEESFQEFAVEDDDVLTYRENACTDCGYELDREVHDIDSPYYEHLFQMPSE